MSYLHEILANRRRLGAAVVGLSSGYMLNYYLMGLFLPALIRQFGWSKSQVALIGATYLVALVVHPVVGRLTDLFGVRRIAAVGVIACPTIYLAYSAMRGSFMCFLLLNTLQMAVVGATTTTIVYPRLIAERFQRARGLALSIAAAAPVLTAAMAAPLLSGFIHSHGWRAGYRALAVATGLGGAIALLLIPPHPGRPAAAKPGARRAIASALAAYVAIIRAPAFIVMAVGSFFCSLTLQVQGTQLKLILLARHVSDETAALMISLYAISIVTARLCCGLALDSFPSHIVAALGFALPAVGLFLLASGSTNPLWLVVAVATVGCALGAEFDIIGYLLMRFLRVEVYSTAYSLLSILMTVSAALGALLLSYTLHLSHSFSPFLYVSGVSTLLGAAAFATLRRVARQEGNAPLERARAAASLAQPRRAESERT